MAKRSGCCTCLANSIRLRLNRIKISLCEYFSSRCLSRVIPYTSYHGAWQTLFLYQRQLRRNPTIYFGFTCGFEPILILNYIAFGIDDNLLGGLVLPVGYHL